MSKRDDEDVFAKLDKIYRFCKMDKELILPKELARDLIPDVDNKKCTSKPKIVKTPEVKTKSTSILKEKTNIFDLTDISDIDPKLDIKIVDHTEKDFTSRIFNLFDIAKQCGMNQLTTDQITCAYYKVYSANKKDVIRTKAQIANKLYFMDSTNRRNFNNDYLVKVKNTNSTYTLSDHK